MGVKEVAASESDRLDVPKRAVTRPRYRNFRIVIQLVASRI